MSAGVEDEVVKLSQGKLRRVTIKGRNSFGEKVYLFNLPFYTSRVISTFQLSLSTWVYKLPATRKRPLGVVAHTGYSLLSSDEAKCSLM